MKLSHLAVALALSAPLPATCADTISAVNRTNAQNYKDRALAACIATAYKDSPAGQDATITTSVFLEWTYFDLDKGNEATDRLVQTYLARDYSTPVEGYAGARFDLLKCLDMYHSKELDAQVAKVVKHPSWIGDRPPAKKKQNP